MEYNIVVRVDERLIHGQVALSWTSLLQITRIMVVDDEVAKDSFQLPLLKMACPQGIKLSVLPVVDAAKNLLANKYTTDKIFLLVKRPETLIGLWDAGIHMSSVNIGNMSGRENAVLLKKDVCVTPENIETLKELNKRGVKLTARTVPSDPEVDLMNLINK